MKYFLIGPYCGMIDRWNILPLLYIGKEYNMGFFSKFERRVEDGFDDMGDKFFDSQIGRASCRERV